jgi:hypothetical protein
MLLSCDDAWFGGWRGPSLVLVRAGRLSYAGPLHDYTDQPEAHLAGSVLAPFTDSHVHLGRFDPALLVAGGIGRVVDLGWDPEIAGEWPGVGTAIGSSWPEVSVAGGILTAPGGYPARSEWAPAEAAIGVADVEAAESAVARQQDLGASVLTVALDSDTGPVWDDDLLVAVVEVAHARGLPVIAFVRGLGQTRRASRARVDALAHTPWSEHLDENLLDDLAHTMTWISGLGAGTGAAGGGRSAGSAGGPGGAARSVALDNLRRFHARGGHVLYGSGLGAFVGDSSVAPPLGLDPRELAGLASAGLSLDDVLRALTPGSDQGDFDSRLATWIPGSRPMSVADLARASTLTVPELVGLSE